MSATSRLRSSGSRFVGAPERLDVGAQRGERGAQLMRGVGDQSALGRLGALQRGHHLVEARSEPAELVVAADLDPVGEVVGAGDLLGGVGDLAGRGQRGSRHHRAERGRQRDAAGAHRGQDDDQRVEGVVGVLERAGDLDRAALRQRLGQHAGRVPCESTSLNWAAPPSIASVRSVARDRELEARAGIRDGRAIGPDQLGQGRGCARARGRDRPLQEDPVAGLGPLLGGLLPLGRRLGTGRERRRLAVLGEGGPLSGADRHLSLGRARDQRRHLLRPLGDHVGLVAQVVVDVAAQPVTDQDVDESRGEQHRERDRQRREQREPAAQGHFSRSEYPTPRTVWISRGSPPSSVLRRR